MNNVIELRSKPGGPDLIDTPTNRKVRAAIEDAFLYQKLVVIRGGFGVGKSFACQRFTAEHDYAVVYAALNPATRAMTGALAIICTGLNVIAKGDPRQRHISKRDQHHPWLAYAEIRRAFEIVTETHREALLIVDEAQHAQPNLLDTLRSLYDEGVCGLVIAGNERLFNPRRGRMETADFGALLSRAHHVLDIPAPTGGDIDAVLHAYGVASADSRALLRERAAAGGIRELIAVIGKARLLSGSTKVGLKHIKAAVATTGLAMSTWTARRR